MSAGWVPSEVERDSVSQASPLASGGLLPASGGPWLVIRCTDLCLRVPVAFS